MKFIRNKIEYTIVVDPNKNEIPIHRLNAMTIYDNIKDWLIGARSIDMDDYYLYLILCKTESNSYLKWVDVNPEEYMKIQNQL